jgi:hypothetical protein
VLIATLTDLAELVLVKPAQADTLPVAPKTQHLLATVHPPPELASVQALQLQVPLALELATAPPTVLTTPPVPPLHTSQV